MNLSKIGTALQRAANNAAEILRLCKEAGVTPVARKKPGRKPRAPKKAPRPKLRAVAANNDTE